MRQKDGSCVCVSIQSLGLACLHLCVFLCACVWAGLWAEQTLKLAWLAASVGLHCCLPRRRGAVRWSRSTPRTTETPQSKGRQGGRQIKVIAVGSDCRWDRTVDAELQSHVQFEGTLKTKEELKYLSGCKVLNPVKTVVFLQAAGRLTCSQPSGLHLSDRGYVYLVRRRGQHRPASRSLTHYYDILPAGRANTPISLRAIQEKWLLPLRNPQWNTLLQVYVCLWKSLSLLCCNHLKIEISREAWLVMNHV